MKRIEMKIEVATRRLELLESRVNTVSFNPSAFEIAVRRLAQLHKQANLQLLYSYLSETKD